MKNIVVPDSKPGELKILDNTTATCFNIFNILTISPTKFYVRGVEVPQDENEALAVYNAFCEAMMYKRKNHDYDPKKQNGRHSFVRQF